MFRLSASHFLLIILGIAVTVGCNAAPTATPAPSPTRVVLPTVAPTAIPTSAPVPTQAPTLAPTQAPTPAPTVKTTPTRTPTVPPGSMRVKIFFIALNDNGKSGKKVGCGDSVVAVDRIIPATNAPLRASLNELLAVREPTYGQSGLNNALYQSTLKVDSIMLVGGKAMVYLTGKVVLGGTCDNPRFEAQIKETVLQFSTVTQVSVFINNVALEQVLSQKGN